MSDRKSCTHHFEHVKQTRPFTEREYMQCTKCGLQNPLGLFQHWDAERDGPAFKWPARGGVPSGYFNRGGHIPGRPHPVRLKDGERLWIQADDQLIEYIHEVDVFGEQWRLVKAIKKPDPRKRQPIVKVRRKRVWIIFRTWEWECQICYISDHQSTWRKAYAQADRHARNHH